jgi:hypothetical protein
MDAATRLLAFLAFRYVLSRNVWHLQHGRRRGLVVEEKNGVFGVRV